MRLDIKRGLVDIEVDGVNIRDYPDFVDAYISSAIWKDTGEKLTENELTELNENYQDIIYNAVINRLF